MRCGGWAADLAPLHGRAGLARVRSIILDGRLGGGAERGSDSGNGGEAERRGGGDAGEGSGDGDGGGGGDAAIGGSDGGDRMRMGWRRGAEAIGELDWSGGDARWRRRKRRRRWWWPRSSDGGEGDGDGGDGNGRRSWTPADKQSRSTTTRVR